jgi:glutamine synthetase
MNPSEITALVENQGIRLFDFKFSDLSGNWQHFTTTLSNYSEDLFFAGLPLERLGSRSIQGGEQLIVPDPNTGWIDGFSEARTLSFICDLQDPVTREPLNVDPRGVARKAELYLRRSGIAETAHFSPKTQFFIFDDVRFDYRTNGSFHNVDSVEGIWNGVREEFPNLGYKIRAKEGFSPVLPADTLQDIRNDICLELERAGLQVLRHSHGAAGAGHAQIETGFASLLTLGDQLQCLKYIARNSAKRHNKVATFMPKPLFGDYGSRMPTCIFLLKEGRNLFEGDSHEGLSSIALFFIGGLLKHAHTLAAFTNPTTNSYRRGGADCDDPFVLAYSAHNSFAAIRVSAGSSQSKWKCIEFRAPDSAAAPYTAFAATLMAGLDGIQNQISPGDALEIKSDRLVSKDYRSALPDSLPGALSALEADHEFLLGGDVFTTEFISSWIDLKSAECESLLVRPHPYEFALYFDR